VDTLGKAFSQGNHRNGWLAQLCWGTTQRET
jgi:hypothetical protein